MRTKAKFIEAIQHELSGGSVVPDNIAKYDERVIASRVSDLYDKALLGIWLQQKSTKDFSSFDMFTKSYDVQVQYDATRDEYYADMPVSLVAIPSAVAIREVRAKGVPDGLMMQMESNSLGLFNNTLVGDVIKDRCYYQEGKKTVFYNYDNFTDVMLRLIPTFQDLDDDDEFYEPILMGGTTLFDAVVQSMRGVQATPKDTVNDAQ